MASAWPPSAPEKGQRSQGLSHPCQPSVVVLDTHISKGITHTCVSTAELSLQSNACAETPALIKEQQRRPARGPGTPRSADVWTLPQWQASRQTAAPRCRDFPQHEPSLTSVCEGVHGSNAALKRERQAEVA